MTSASPPARPAYRVRARSVEACNCALGCNCSHGRLVLFVDQSASPEEVGALVTIMTGEAIAGTVELETMPIRNPLAGGEEIEVHMIYPKGGILWNDGNIVTTSTMRVTHDSLQMQWPGKFSVIAEVSWTNAA
jgi:hypothetical protein